MNPILTKNYEAAAAVSQYRIAKFGASDGLAGQAADTIDPLIGVFDLSASQGERVDVVRQGIAEVELGGAITRGAQVTTDADGKGVALAAADYGMKQAVAAGEDASVSAQAIVVTGIRTTDVLVSVVRVVGAGTDATDIADVTAKFTITDDDEITQADTDMSSDKLIVTYRRYAYVLGQAEVSGASGDIIDVAIAPSRVG